MKTKKITICAILAALALIIFVLESLIPSLIPVPGIKLGLANVVTLFALYYLGPAYAALILVTRVVLGCLLTGQTAAFLYSLVGGALALLTAMLMKKIFKDSRKMWIVSVFSAAAHNLGQMAVALFLTGTWELIWYLPLLMVSGIITGALTGILAGLVFNRVKKAVNIEKNR